MNLELCEDIFDLEIGASQLEVDEAIPESLSFFTRKHSIPIIPRIVEDVWEDKLFPEHIVLTKAPIGHDSNHRIISFEGVLEDGFFDLHKIVMVKHSLGTKVMAGSNLEGSNKLLGVHLLDVHRQDTSDLLEEDGFSLAFSRQNDIIIFIFNILVKEIKELTKIPDAIFVQHSQDVQRILFPEACVGDPEFLEKELCLSDVSSLKVGISIFEVGEAFGADWVIKPVVLHPWVSMAKLNQATDKLGVSQVLVIVEVEQNFISTHLFEINIVMKRCWLVTNAVHRRLRILNL